MAVKVPSHRIGCMCPVCRASRGETRRTKKQFTTSLNIAVLTNFREFARERNKSLTEALEEAMRLYMQKEEQEEKRQWIERLFREEAHRTDLREFSDQEIAGWLEADKLDPELRAQIEAKSEAIKRAKQ